MTEGLHHGRACFETRPLGAPQHEDNADGSKKTAHPEEAAKRPSRRTLGARPAVAPE
jgi:hypothetical protein